MTLGGFLEMVSILAGFICVVLASFLVATPSDRKRANLYLAVFLILTAIDMAGWLMPRGDAFRAWLEFVRFKLAYLQMPFFTAFILATLYKDERPGRWAWIHGIPLLLALLLGLPGSQIPFDRSVADVSIEVLTPTELAVSVAGLHVQYYAYIGFVIWALFRFWQIHRQQFSGDLPTVFRLLVQMVGLSVFAHSLVLVRTFAGWGGSTLVFAVLAVIGGLLILGVLTWLTLIALLHPDMFRQVDRSFAAARRDSDARELARSDDGDRARLLTHMTEARPYLEADLTLAGLADAMALTPRELSGLINRAFGVHFFDFINRYRVDAAKSALLTRPRQSVLDVAHAVGFNSKSSFNSAFRRHAGMSPTEFRKADASTSERLDSLGGPQSG